MNFKHYLSREILNNSPDKFSWIKILKKVRSKRSYNFIFWWRLAWILKRKNGQLYKTTAKFIHKRIQQKYSIEIPLGVDIGPGFSTPHPVGIVIRKGFIAGENLTIRQNTTIGTDRNNKIKTVFGKNVDIGANCCIIGNDLRIGDNVKIGAMTFVNKDVPSNVTVINKRETSIV